MHIAAIFDADLAPHLPDGLQEGQALDIAHRAADLDDGHVSAALLAGFADAVLDGVGHMGDDLYRAPQKVAAPLLLDDPSIDLPRGDIGIAGEVHVSKAFIVAQIEIGLGAVFQHEHLAVLKGRHGAGVHIEVGVELLQGDGDAPCLEDAPNRGGGHAFAQRGNDAAGAKDKTGHACPPNECGARCPGLEYTTVRTLRQIPTAVTCPCLPGRSCVRANFAWRPPVDIEAAQRV